METLEQVNKDKEVNKKKKEIVGLKMMRKNPKSDIAEFKCDNCKCARYSPCGCQKKKG